MALTVNLKPSGFQPVAGGNLIYQFTEATVVGKPNYRVELNFNGLGLPKFEFRPDTGLIVKCDIAPILASVLKLSTLTTDRFKQTYIKYQAVWDGGSDAQVYLGMDVIYFYVGNNNSLNSRTKFHVDRSLPGSNKYLIPTPTLQTHLARTAYMDWLQRTTDALTFTVTGQVVATDGGTLTKTSGAAAWDSQGYSTQSYVNSCYVSFIPVTARFMIGLNSDPTLNADFSSIDYAWDYDGASLNIFESGSYTGNTVSVVPGVTKLSIIYDGTNVVYYKDGVQVRSVARAVGAALFLDSSFLNVGSQATQIEFGASVRWVTSANITKDSQRQFRKTGGAAAWDEQAYSTESYTTNVYCKSGMIDGAFGWAFGLDAVPAVSATFTAIDYCWLMDSAGLLAIYENNVLIASGYVYSTNSIFSIVYDGVNVIYYIDGVSQRSIARAVGVALFFDSSFFTANTSALTNIEFGTIPIVNYLNYNNGADVVLNTQVFTGEKNTLQSIAYAAFNLDGTVTVKQVGTNTVFATILNQILTESENPVYLRWLNDLGGLTTWMFDYNQDLTLDPNTYNRYLTKGLYAISITYEQWLALNELNKDGAIYNDTYKVGQFVQDITDLANPINLITIPRNSLRKSKQSRSNFNLIVRYPEIQNSRVTQ